jgi:hypothetical protein
MHMLFHPESIIQNYLRDASYSHNYTNASEFSERYMFRAKVLVGKFTQGSSDYRRPPEIPGESHKLYDACIHPEMLSFSTSACMCFFFLNQKSEIIYLLLHICNMYKLSENRKKIYIQALETGKKSSYICINSLTSPPD